MVLERESVSDPCAGLLNLMDESTGWIFFEVVMASVKSRNCCVGELLGVLRLDYGSKYCCSTWIDLWRWGLGGWRGALQMEIDFLMSLFEKVLRDELSVLAK